MIKQLARDVAQGRKNAVRELAENIHVMTDYSLAEFIGPQDKPIVSLYIPIKRTEREERRDEWDRIEFKDLMKQAEDELLATYDKKNVELLIERMHYILDNEDLPLWLDASKGLAFLMDETDTYVINMSFAPRSMVVVDEAYMIKPLLRNVQYLMHYKLLLLSTDFFTLLDGNYNGVHFEVLPDNVKEYFTEEFADYDGDKTPLDYYSLEGHMSPFHGWKSRNDVTKEEAEKFFRSVAKDLNDQVLRDCPTPVILVTLPEHEHMFREVEHVRTLLPETILKDPKNMSGQELRDEAVKIMQGIEDKEARELCDQYNEAAAHDKGSDDWNNIMDALEQKKIEVLLVKIGGEKKVCDASCDDKIKAVSATLLEGGAIGVLDADHMPTDSDVAAIYRY